MANADNETYECARRSAKRRIWIGVVLLAGSIAVAVLFSSQLFEAHPKWSERYGYTVSMPGGAIVIVAGIAGVLSLIDGVSQLKKLK